SSPCRHRARSCDLARFRGSHARNDIGQQSYRPTGRRVHDLPAGSCRGRAAGYGRMSAAPLRVLIVDDEPPIRKLLRMGLAAQGYQIMEAPNGKAALELIEQGPDLIVLDLGLPDVQGLDLLSMLRARNERAPIVVLSSRGDETERLRRSIWVLMT